MRIPVSAGSAAALIAGSTLLVLLSVGVPDGVPGDVPNGTAPSCNATEAVEWESRLSAASVRDRAEAESALLRRGALANRTLDEIARSGNPEAAYRARRILRTIAGDDGGSASRRIAAEALLRDVTIRPGTFDEGSEFLRRVDELAPESHELLAVAVARYGTQDLIGAPMAEALAARPTPDGIAALVHLWRADQVTPSAAIGAARRFEAALRADGASSALHDAAAVAAATLAPSRTDSAPRRRALVAWLAALAGSEAASRIEPFLADADGGVRLEAVRALGRIAATASVRSMTNIARTDRDAAVREAALDSLRSAHGVIHPDAAVAAASDPAPRVRRAAARLLATDATTAEVPILERLTTDPIPGVRAAARAALRRLRTPTCD